jgi:hypothetical protein
MGEYTKFMVAKNTLDFFGLHVGEYTKFMVAKNTLDFFGVTCG